MKASHVAIGYCNGPSLGGVPRQVEAYPPEIRPQDRAVFDDLARQRAKLANESVALSGNLERKVERASIEAQMEVEAKMIALRMVEGWKIPHPRTALPTASVIMQRGAMIPSSLNTGGAQGAKISPSPASTNQTVQGKRKKKKRKNKARAGEAGARNPPETQSPANKGRKSGDKPTPSRAQPGSSRGSQQLPTREKKPPTQPTPTLPALKDGEKWSQVVGRRANYKGKAEGDNARGAPSSAKPRGPGKGKPLPRPKRPSKRPPPPKKGKGGREGRNPPYRRGGDHLSTRRLQGSP